MAASIADGGSSDTLTYDTEHQRISQVATGVNAGTTLYLNDPVSGVMEEAFTTSVTTYRDYIMTDEHIIALRSQGPSTTPPLWGSSNWGSFNWTASTPSPLVDYFTLDHLGSISVVTNSSGAVTERDSYDPWGLRRNPDGTAASCGSITSATTRGFTNQEMMDNICFINFNARVYDPSVGRFMSADSTIPNAFDGQSYNRYSYVNNGPLSLTDPTGMAPEAPYHASPDADSSPFAQDDRALNQSLIMQYDFVSVAVTTTQPSVTASNGVAQVGITSLAPVGTVSTTNGSSQTNSSDTPDNADGATTTIGQADANSQTARNTAQAQTNGPTGKFAVSNSNDNVSGAQPNPDGSSDERLVAQNYEKLGSAIQGATAAQVEGEIPRGYISQNAAQTLDELSANSTTEKLIPKYGQTTLIRRYPGNLNDMNKMFSELADPSTAKYGVRAKPGEVVNVGFITGNTRVVSRTFSRATLPGEESFPTLEFQNPLSQVTIKYRFTGK